MADLDLLARIARLPGVRRRRIQIWAVLVLGIVFVLVLEVAMPGSRLLTEFTAELSAKTLLAVFLVALFCEYVDSSLGMGYGSTLTPLLLLAGFSPLQIVPCVLLSAETSPADPAASLPSPSEGTTWKLVWSDEFDGDTIDTSKWEIVGDHPRRDGFWVKEDAYVDGKGHLVNVSSSGLGDSLVHQAMEIFPPLSGRIDNNENRNKNACERIAVIITEL